MRKEDQNFIRISGTVTTPIKISPGEKRNEAVFGLRNKDFSRIGIKQNTFEVRWYAPLKNLETLQQGDRVMVVGKAATFKDTDGHHKVFLTTKEVIFY